MNTYGSEERKQKLKIGFLKVHQKTRSIIHEIIPELKLNSNLDESTFIKRENLVQSRLAAEFKSMDKYLIARNFFTKFINDGNKKSTWSYPVPEPIFRLQRVNPLRTLNWFTHCKNISNWAKTWELSCERKTVLHSSTPEDLLSDVLCSAILYGGLCIPAAITSLAN